MTIAIERPGLVVHQGDALAVLRTLGSESVHCCVCSPPYMGLRKYLSPGDPDAALEVGQEATPAAFVARLVGIFRELRRVLRSDGTCWVNIGSSFASGKIDTQEYVLRDDLTAEETAYVYEELAKHLRSQATTVPEMWRPDEPSEQTMPSVPYQGGSPTGELSREGV